MRDYKKWLDNLLAEANRTLEPYEKQAALWAVTNIGTNQEIGREITPDGDGTPYSVTAGYQKMSHGWSHPYEIHAWGFEASTFGNLPDEDDNWETFIFFMSATYDAHMNLLGLTFEFSGYGIATDPKDDLSDFAALLNDNMFET